MSTFDLYAAYYDLLYRDKDYRAESEYVASLLPESTKSVLELGCGTGGHAVVLAERGWRVDGIDLSVSMVERANARRAAAPPALRERLSFTAGDVRTHRRGGRHDAVVSLFHVMSYQTSNDDLVAAFATARAHVEPGGVFVFDFWHGPGVLSDRPRHVVKEVADDRISVRRTTTPTMHVEANRVDVRFDVEIRAADRSAVRDVVELHPMRYLFLPEIDLVAAQTGFQRSASFAWMKREAPGDRDWYACVALTAT
jgi:SAM-dependent methyltransferase